MRGKGLEGLGGLSGLPLVAREGSLGRGREGRAEGIPGREEGRMDHLARWVSKATEEEGGELLPDVRIALLQSLHLCSVDLCCGLGIPVFSCVFHSGSIRWMMSPHHW
jgi:hypothetical protein